MTVILMSLSLQVRFNDQVKLESVKTEGQFLHVSQRLFKSIGFNVLMDWYGFCVLYHVVKPHVHIMGCVCVG